MIYCVEDFKGITLQYCIDVDLHGANKTVSVTKIVKPFSSSDGGTGKVPYSLNCSQSRLGQN